MRVCQVGQILPGLGRALRGGIAGTWRSPGDLHASAHLQARKASVDEVGVPAALALRQRRWLPTCAPPSRYGDRLLNHLRLLFSRVGSYLCPNGHRVPTLAQRGPRSASHVPAVRGPSTFGAEDGFNSGGACARCVRDGRQRVVNRASLVPDESSPLTRARFPRGDPSCEAHEGRRPRNGRARTNVPFRDP